MNKYLPVHVEINILLYYPRQTLYSSIFKNIYIYIYMSISIKHLDDTLTFKRKKEIINLF